MSWNLPGNHEPPITIGIIDVGTNSVHLLVGIFHPDGAFHLVRRERALTRLGEGCFVSGTLSPRAVRRTMAALARFARLARRARVEHIEAVSTSAVRDATNGGAFVRLVRKRLQLPLRVISGREEARLIALGVLSGERAKRPSLVVTIGGGSAQVIVGSGARVRYVTSLRLGASRLAQRFIRHDPPLREEVSLLEAHVRKAWSPVIGKVRRYRWTRVLGSSAVIHHVIKAAWFRDHPRTALGKRPSISQRALRRFVTWLSTSTAAERLRLRGIDPHREELALPTALALLAWMEGCGVSTLLDAPGSLREGLVIEWVRKHRARGRSRHSTVRSYP
jgi:exopolyphosphatase/guanosine-5'-triphosphate,3'-diphosphate pyrophosphatase